METIFKLNAYKPVTEADLKAIADLPDKTKGEFSSVLKGLLEDLEWDPIFAVLDLQLKTLVSAFEAMRTKTPQSMVGFNFFKSVYSVAPFL